MACGQDAVVSGKKMGGTLFLCEELGPMFYPLSKCTPPPTTTHGKIGGGGICTKDCEPEGWLHRTLTSRLPSILNRGLVVDSRESLGSSAGPSLILPISRSLSLSQARYIFRTDSTPGCRCSFFHFQFSNCSLCSRSYKNENQRK